MNARVHKFLKSLGIVVCIWFWAAVVGMFVERRLPFLHPFVTWTFRVYLGLFTAGAIGLVVVAPGVYMAKEIYEAVTDLRASRLERRLTQILVRMCGIAALSPAGRSRCPHLLWPAGRREAMVYRPMLDLAHDPLVARRVSGTKVGTSVFAACRVRCP